MFTQLRPQLAYVARASRVMARDPAAGVERVRARVDRRHDIHRLDAMGLSTDEIYPIDDAWSRHLHDALGLHWPCPGEAEAGELYLEIIDMFRAMRLPERYAGWCDGGASFTRAAWCLSLHLRPSVAVETGVARGVTSRHVLEALERNREGHLWSIDLPSIDSRFHGQIGIAVPDRCKERWTYLEGSSRRRLPPLLAELGTVDLFIHDSVHTSRNTRFELDSAWAALRPGGALLVDDVYQSLAFHEFVDAVHPRWSCIAAAPDHSYRFGLALR